LYAVLGDLPPPDTVAERLRTAIQDVDAAELIDQDLNLATFVLYAATLQSVHLADQGIRDHLKRQLVSAAALLEQRGATGQDVRTTGEDVQEPLRRLPSKLLESALNVCIDPTRPARDSMAEFARLLTELSEALPSAIPAFRSIVQRLCEDLPSSVGEPLWSLLVRLRAY
jgi:hypothetical protein